MKDGRSKQERKFDDSTDRTQKRRWLRAQSIAGPAATVTQVGPTGFHVREPGMAIPVFQSWPRAAEATEGSKFGRVIEKGI